MNGLIALFGPTAVGKSETAVELALRVGGEVVNADAVQLYRGLDRGSAKPTLAERKGVPHHLIDIADPDQTVSVAVYARLAQETVREVQRRGRVPIVSGGSGLYLRAALGEWDAFGAPPRQELRRSLAALSDAELHARAVAVDPRAASLSVRDRPRLLRVIERGAVPARAALGASENVWKIGLYLPRQELYRRIDERAAAIWPDVLRETERLGLFAELGDFPALRAIGYREALSVLAGALSRDEGLRQMSQRTRKLAKRQWTWWRREPNTVWLRSDDAVRRALGLLDHQRHTGRP